MPVCRPVAALLWHIQARAVKSSGLNRFGCDSLLRHAIHLPARQRDLDWRSSGKAQSLGVGDGQRIWEIQQLALARLLHADGASSPSLVTADRFGHQRTIAESDSIQNFIPHSTATTTLHASAAIAPPPCARLTHPYNRSLPQQDAISADCVAATPAAGALTYSPACYPVFRAALRTRSSRKHPLPADVPPKTH